MSDKKTKGLQGNKTHQQQQDIIAGRVDTSNADKDFDPTPDLKRQEAGIPVAPGKRPVRLPDDDSDLTSRGYDQESSHNKKDGRPEDGGA